MTERAMRQISLRAFRDQIADLHQPVEVSRRVGKGDIQVLGYWTPYVQIPEDATPLEPWKPGDPPPTATISVENAQGETVVPPQTFEIPIPDDVEESPGPKVIKTPEEAAAATAQAIATVDRPIHPVPKPSQRKKR